VDLDKAFVSAIIEGGYDALKIVRDKGIRADHLEKDSEGLKAYAFLIDYTGSYGEMPTPAALHGKTGIQLEAVAEPAAFFADELLNRALHKDLKEGGIEFTKHLDEARPQEALDHMEVMLRAVRRTHRHHSSQIDRVPALWEDVLAYYDKIKAGERGILTPWPTINEETLGFWPEDLALFVARVGIGKTWCAAMLAHHAWKEGNKVLFATTEISKMRIAMRFCALHFGLPYSAIRRAKLDAFVEKKWRDDIKAMINAEGLYVIGGDFDFRPENFENAVEQVQDEDDSEEGKILSVFDGAYLLRAEGKNRIERAANAFDELKRICKRTAVPNVVTMQFNREVKANQAKTMSVEKIALTDVASWNADLIYGMVQTQDMKADKRMIFQPLKTREFVGEEIEMIWDLDNMKFEELENMGGMGDDTNPFDTGIDPNAEEEAPF
jgi:replicative DNA helicase